MTDDSEAGPSSGFGPAESRRPPAGNGPGPQDAGAGPADAPGVPDAAAQPPGSGESLEPVDPHSVDGQSADSQADDPDAVPTPTWRERRRAKKAAKRARPRRKAPWWEIPALVVLAVVIAIVVKTFVIQPFYIPSQSMEKTLHGCPGCHGDRILVNKPIFDFRDPHPGDIVVFNAPKGWDDEPISKPPSNPIVRTVRGFGQLIGFVPPDGQVLVKRVIAVGGQTVKGDAQGHVMVSTHGPAGPYRTLVEPYVYIVRSEGGLRSFGPVTVPKGRLWVMGDHRSDSADSRYHCGPNASDTTDDTDCDPTTSTVPVDDVIGKAFVIAWPPSRWRTLGTPKTFESLGSAVAPIVPSAVSTATVVPLFLIRRRRRSRARASRRGR